MNKLLLGLGAAVLIAIVVAFAALIGGTILYFVWPIAIPAAFPGAVASGAITGKMSWWASVCLAWVFAILFKSTQTNNNK